MLHRSAAHLHHRETAEQNNEDNSANREKNYHDSLLERYPHSLSVKGSVHTDLSADHHYTFFGFNIAARALALPSASDIASPR